PQTERAYQKQPTIFQNKKRVLLGEGGKEKLPRYYKNIGLGFKTPKEAEHPPLAQLSLSLFLPQLWKGRWQGNDIVIKLLKIRDWTTRKSRDFNEEYPKLRTPVQTPRRVPSCPLVSPRDVQIGDIVTVGECRPLSKTVRFNVLKVTKAAGTKKQFQKF
ncbi:40S ribosomal protein S11, partial [Calypte anna]